MKQFIKKVFVISLPVFFLMISVNYFGDAANIFNREYEKRMAEIIISKSNAKYKSNYSERLLQKELILKESMNYDVIFIGSSRGMLLTSDMFPNSTFFNRGVSGASIEDLIAIYQLCKSNNKLPKKIIIGIDPWVFNDNNDKTRWKTAFRNEVNLFANLPSTPYLNIVVEKIRELFSFSYFQNSFKPFIKMLVGKREYPQPTQTIDNSSTLKLADGSIWYGTDTYRLSTKKIDEKVQSWLAGGAIYGLENFNTISNKNWEFFKLLINEMANNDIEISFYMEPYHPLIYEKVKKTHKMVIKTEEKIRNYAKENKIKIIGSFNPSKLGLSGNSFYDGMHCNEVAVKQIVESTNAQHGI
tara:strand:- start:2955 stop:4022 length:1068 start_codon:yes stop_codon:yes gene_type:complete